MNRVVVPATLLSETFDHFQQCGRGQRECHVLWLSAWDDPNTITRVVRSTHDANAVGYQVDGDWLNKFWLELAETGHGVRVQVHTHAHDAFHSSSDDTFPIVHTPGFLSLVIPDFGTRPPSLDGSFLAEIAPTGDWISLVPTEKIAIIR